MLIISSLLMKIVMLSITTNVAEQQLIITKEIHLSKELRSLNPDLLDRKNFISVAKLNYVQRIKQHLY
jgi:hypothetical protein